MQKEVTEEERKNAIKLNYNKRLDYLLNKAFVSEDELMSLIKNFFSEYLQVNYVFTYEELGVELNKIYINAPLREAFEKYLQKLSYIQFCRQKELTQDEVKKLLEEFRDLINKLIIIEQKTKDTMIESFLKRVKEKPSPEKIKTAINTANITGQKQEPEKKMEKINYLQTEENKPDFLKINESLEIIYFHLDENRMHQAIEEYRKLINLYHELDYNDKAKYYEVVYELYKKLKKI